MEKRRMSDGSQHMPSSSITMLPTARVDPKYPLLRPISPSTSLQNPYAPNGGVPAKDGGLGRTASRRRKAGEQSDIKSPLEDSVLPAAPDVPESPKGPPVSYRIPFSNGDTSVVRSNSSKSFAARAGAIPDRVDPSLANSITANRMPVLENGVRVRRAGSGQASGVASSQGERSTAPLSSPSSANPSSAQRFSNAVSPSLQIPPNTIPIQPALPNNLSSPTKSPVSSPMRSGSRRVSSGGTDRRTEWAPDRSPLQKLEVKLNDISKEEKRARVQEAEQLLRDSQAAEGTHRPHNTLQHTSSKRSPARVELSERSPQQDRSIRQYELNTVSGGAGDPSTTRGLGQDTHGKGRQRHNDSVGPVLDSAETLGGRSPETPNQATSRIKADHTRRRSVNASDNRRGEERGVRFQSSEYDDDAKMIKSPSVTARPGAVPKAPVHAEAVSAAAGAESPNGERSKTSNQRRVFNGDRSKIVDSPRRVPTQQQKLYAEKAENTSRNDSAAAYGGAPDPFPGYPSHHSDHALKYEVSPQTAAGINARQSIGFGSSAVPVTAGPERQEHQRHHVSEFLHHHRDKAQQPIAPRLGPPKHLDEWKRGGIARLTLADIMLNDDNGDENNAWWEGGGSASKRRSSGSSAVDRGSLALDGGFDGMRRVRIRVPAVPTTFNPPMLLKCGPLLRYTGMRREKLGPSSSQSRSLVECETWRGSVMIVTEDSESTYDPAPTLRLFHQPLDLLPPPPQKFDGTNGEDLPSEYVDPIAGLPKMSRNGGTVYVKPVEDLEEGVDVSRIENDDGLYEVTRTANVPTSYGKADELLGRNPLPALNKKKPSQRSGQQLGKVREVQGVRLHAERGVTFWRFKIEVELGDKQARIAYRINKAASIGFWVPARGQTMNMMFHSCNGFSMSVNSADFSGPDPLWRDVLNTHQTKPFHVMLGGGDQIYNDLVMRQTTLFKGWLGIKNPIHKRKVDFTPDMQDELEAFYLDRYSMWFSQGLFGMANSQIPMVNLWDDHDIIDGFGSYPHHFMSSPVFSGLGNIAFKYYMLFQHQSVADEMTSDEPSWLLGASPGPYINEFSRSIFITLGKNVVLLGLDCRTERMRDQILSNASYDEVFDRCRREIVRGETKHLIVLLGVPIAYPRLVWLENILTSRLMDPIKALGRAGLLGGFLNEFDGGVEILDDLDDHWTARNHKHERKWFVERLQDLAADKSVRITILGGDVHLAAIGQFYSNKKLKIPKDRDPRYMPNVISSAIVNTPPPELMGDVLNKRNKVHHFDAETDEDMIPMFTHDTDGKLRNNKRLLPRRNWCAITEYHPGSTPPPSPPLSSLGASEESLSQRSPNRLQRTLSLTKGDAKPTNLFRRLTGRGPPSPAYTPDEDNSPSSPLRSSSNGYFPSQQKASIPGEDGNNSSRNVTAPLPTRPINSFQRRPTNLSEKAAAKGGLIATEISLEHGLDIVLNCEVHQRDPAGITVPYRLLVPALWYEGGADALAGRERKQSWFSRLNSRRGTRAAAVHQGSGEWGQSQSDSGSESEAARETARFGSGGKLLKRNPSIRPSTMQTYAQSQGQDHSQPPTPFLTPDPHYHSGQGNALGVKPTSGRQPGADTPTRSQPATPNFSPGPGSRPLAGTSQAMQAHTPPLTSPLAMPKRRMGGKFDAEGNSNFFGRSDHVQGGADGGGGYGGIEAYKEKEKGWRKFF